MKKHKIPLIIASNLLLSLLILTALNTVYAQEGVTVVRLEPLTQQQYEQTLSTLRTARVSRETAADIQLATGLQQNAGEQIPSTVITAFENRMNPASNQNYFNQNNPDDAAALTAVTAAFRTLDRQPQRQEYLVTPDSRVIPQNQNLLNKYVNNRNYYVDESGIVNVNRFGIDPPADDQTAAIVKDVLVEAHRTNPEVRTISSADTLSADSLIAANADSGTTRDYTPTGAVCSR